MSKVTLYIDYLSQPSRAVLAFCLINNIPHEVIETEIVKGATDTEEFALISPTRTVPAMTHNGFSLSESNAILIYLSSAFNTPDHWYPSDPRLQAQVNIYLNWHHLNIRYGCGHYYYRKVVRPLFSSRGFSPEFEKEMLFVQQKSLEFVENILKSSKFVAGTSQISIADLICYSEIVHLCLLRFDFSKYPNIKQWMSCISSIPGIIQANSKFTDSLGEYKL